MRKLIIGMVAVFVLGGSIALADTMTFVTPSGSMANGDSVDAQAVVITGAGTVTVQLTNLITDQMDVGQSLTDFSFDLSNGTVSSASLTASSGNYVTVGTSGAVTGSGSVTPNWGFATSGSTLTLSWFDRSGALSVAGSGPTSGTLLGPETSGSYPYANGSIANNPSHNSFLNYTVSFTFSVTGVTASTTASMPVFSFGTTAGADVNGVPAPSPVPEPASLSLLGIGLIGVGWIVRRKFQQSA